MKICLIGLNLTNLILANVFEEKKLNVDIYLNKKIQKIKTSRTIALSSENFDYLKLLTKSSIKPWKSKEIKIFTEDSQSKEIINFKKKNSEVFNLISYSKLNEIFSKKIKKSKFIKLNHLDTSSPFMLKKIKNYDLVILCLGAKSNLYEKITELKPIKKDYKEIAVTGYVKHDFKSLNTSQFFLK